MTQWIPSQEFRERQERSRDSIRGRGFDGLLAISGPFYDRPGDVAYLTGHYPPFPSVGFQGDYRGLGFSALLLPAVGPGILVVDTPVYREERVTADDVRVTRNVPAALRQALRELGLASGRLAFAGGQVAPWALVQETTTGSGVVLEPVDDLLPALRRRKSPAEIRLLRHAAGVAEIGMKAALDTIEPGRTESEVCAAGIGAGIAAGADFIRYLRVLSGPYSGWQHRWPPATLRVMQDGEMVCLDYIGAVEGYQFDILRARAVGEPSGEQRTMLRVAAAATEAAIAACGPGVPVADVVGAADDVLKAAGYLEHRAKFTGHGIGLETVEAPLIMADSTDHLQEGDVISLEPGILIRDVAGARFEYEVAITEGGHDVLARPSDFAG